MTSHRCTLRLLVVLVVGLGSLVASEAQERVRIQTELGDIDVVLDSEAAPRTVANFLRYVDAGHYDGGQFHRTVTMANQPDNEVKIEVVQASVNAAHREKGFTAIELETTSTTGLSHRDGTISMARGGPNSATSSFFFCIGDQPELDFEGRRNPDGQGFAAFGRIERGLEVVKNVQSSPHQAQRLEPPVKILRIYRLER